MSHVAAPTWAGSGEVRQLTILYELLAAFSRAKRVEEVYEAAITALLAATSADRAAILLFDEDGVIRFKAWRGLTDEYREAVTGHTPWPQGTRDAQPIFIADVQSDESLAGYQEVFAREGIRALGFVPLALEGGVFGKFMLYYAMPHECTRDEIGIAQAIAAHVTLATEHKRVELACARSEQRLQAILDNSTAVIFLKDINSRYQLVNSRYEELFHVSKNEIVGRTDHDLFPSHLADRFRENDRLVLSAGTSLSIEEEAPHDDGIHTYISLKFPLQNPDGSVAGVCGIATDITDRKRLEIAALQLAAIVESSDDAIVGKDLNGIITSWNKGAERIFGYTAAEAIGNPVSLLAASERLNEMPDILSKIRNGERIEHYETRRRRKDGETIDVSLTVSPIRNASGQIIGASKIARDITGRKRAEKEYNLLLAREHEARKTAALVNMVGPRLAAQIDIETLVQEVTDIATALVVTEFGAFFHNVANRKGESYMLYALSGLSQ